MPAFSELFGPRAVMALIIGNRGEDFMIGSVEKPAGRSENEQPAASKMALPRLRRGF